jgi:hypothetical protein
VLGSSVAAGVVRLVRLVRLVGVVGVLSLVVCGVCVGDEGHGFVGQFGGAGPGLGQFNEPSQGGPAGLGVASSGDVFALDGSSGPGPRVQRFDGGGVVQDSFVTDQSFSASGVGVDGGGGSVYVLAFDSASVLVAKYSGSGAPLGGLDVAGSGGLALNFFGCAAGVAVDPGDGTVYVAATDALGAQVIAHFSGADGSFMGVINGAGSPEGALSCPSGLAVDSSHQVYVLDGAHVDRYSSTGVFGARIEDPLTSDRGAPLAVAADPVSGEVYVAESGPVGVQVTQFSAGGGSVIYTFGASNVGGVRAMAVAGDGTVYLSDASSPFVKRFTSFVGPSVTTDPQTVTPTPDPRSATLTGSIVPEGDSRYHFEYGTDLKYGSRTPEVGVGSGSSAVAATATIDGLSPNLSYNYRIVGSNSAGSITGANQVLRTARAPATLDPLAPFVSAITPRSARLFGSINPNRNNDGFTLWGIEYGTTTAYGTTAPTVTTPDGLSTGFCGGFGGVGNCGGDDVTMVASVAGLEPGTLYHFRVVAPQDGFGNVQHGVDQTFITAPAAAAGAIDVTARRATLRATIDAHGVATSYHFNYGPTTSYGSSTPEVDGGHGDGEGLVTQTITGLEASRTYHVQVVAQSDDGVIRSGGDGLFTTPPAPTATAAFPTGVSTSTATLTGTATTFGAAGSYHFELSALDGSYSTVTADRALAAATDPQPVAVAVTGLPAGKTFGVQLVVTGNEATEYSDLITFATAPVPQTAPVTPESDPTTVFGCAAPHIDAYNKQPMAGEVITITGQDLGLSGTVTLGDESFTPTQWGQNGFKVQVPDEAKATLALTASCGRVSNTIAIAVFHEPDNHFSIPNRSITGTTARLVVRVPGPGKLETTGTRTTATKTTVKTAGGEITITTKLNRTGAKALAKAKSHKLKAKIGVRYTPAGGKPATKTLTVTFQHKKTGH